MNREDYERGLRRRQNEHLREIGERHVENWQPCMHDQCERCIGTGLDKQGRPCIHGISCPCPKCSPR